MMNNLKKLQIVEPENGERIGLIRELNNEKGYLWTSMNRSGKPHKTIEDCVKAARRALGNNIQFYNPITFELEF